MSRKRSVTHVFATGVSSDRARGVNLLRGFWSYTLINASCSITGVGLVVLVWNAHKNVTRNKPKT